MELIQSRNYVLFMKAEYFCLFVKEIAKGSYPAPDEVNERPLTPSFFIVHFNIIHVIPVHPAVLHYTE